MGIEVGAKGEGEPDDDWAIGVRWEIGFGGEGRRDFEVAENVRDCNR